jgi:arginyl-tRNA synthetase
MAQAAGAKQRLMSELKALDKEKWVNIEVSSLNPNHPLRTAG